MFELVAYETPLRSTIEKYACIRVIEEKRTGNHRGVFHCFLVYYSKDYSHSTGVSVSCFWAVPLQVPGLTTAIAGSTYPDIGTWCVLLGWRLTEVGWVPFLVAVVTLRVATSVSVVKVTLVAHGEGSNILP